MDERLTRTVIGCAMAVHRTLGAGFLESVYRRGMQIELRRAGLRFEVEKQIVIYYDGIDVGRHRLDLLVERELIVELKAAEFLHKTHYAQLRSYLKATGLPLGLLVNFSAPSVDFRRVYRDARKTESRRKEYASPQSPSQSP